MEGVGGGDQGREAKKFCGAFGGERTHTSGCWVSSRTNFCSAGRSRLTLHSTSSERDVLHRLFTEKRVGIYCGVDPTAPSLHVGHMLPFMVLAWGYVWGLPVTFLVSSYTFHAHPLLCHYFYDKG